MKLLGIDIGGTHTRLRLGTTDGDAHDDARLLTADWLSPEGLGDPSGAAILMERARRLGADAATAVAVGAHGCDSEAQVAAFTAALRAHHPGPLLVLNDALLVGPAAGVADAIGVIAGTGSIVVGRTAGGRLLTAGGHGWMFGDPGSAPGIAREATRAVLLRDDAGAEPGLLARRLMAHFRTASVEDLAVAFGQGASIHRWAEAAPVVFAAAADGSRLAAGVIAAAADELAESVRFVRDRGARAEAIVAAGGVIVHQPQLQRELRRALAEAGVGLPLRVLADDPVAGALELARGLALPADSPTPRQTHTKEDTHDHHIV